MMLVLPSINNIRFGTGARGYEVVIRRPELGNSGCAPLRAATAKQALDARTSMYSVRVTDVVHGESLLLGACLWLKAKSSYGCAGNVFRAMSFWTDLGPAGQTRTVELCLNGPEDRS